MYRNSYADKQTYDRLTNEHRRELMQLPNRQLAHKLSMLSRGKPRTMPLHEYEALMLVAADRLWKAGDC